MQPLQDLYFISRCDRFLETFANVFPDFSHPKELFAPATAFIHIVFPSSRNPGPIPPIFHGLFQILRSFHFDASIIVLATA